MQRISVHTFGGPEVLELEKSDPPNPGPGEILVYLEAAGVNPVDGYRRAGSQGYSPQLPFTPGFEGAGRIGALGPGIDKPGLLPNARVYLGWSLSGTYGQWCIVSQNTVFPLPGNLTMVEAAGLFVPYFTAYRALVHRGRVKIQNRTTLKTSDNKTNELESPYGNMVTNGKKELPDVPDKVFVHGSSGSVGLAAIQWCRYLGLEVWGSAGSAEGAKRVLDSGAKGCIDHTHPEYIQSLQDKAGTFDLILEMNANQNLEKDLNLLSPGSRIVIIGSRGTGEITPRKIMGVEADIRGLVLMKASNEELAETHRELVLGVENGCIRPYIGRVYPLDHATHAHEQLNSRPGVGKIILEIPPIL